MKKKITNKDRKDWDEFIRSNDKLFNKDQLYKEIKIERNETKKIDLHGYSLENANSTVSKYIKKYHSQNIKKLTIITGKGSRSNTQSNPYVSKDLSILKHSVPEFIKSSPELMRLIKEINKADDQDGGSGAINIYLKKFKE